MAARTEPWVYIYPRALTRGPDAKRALADEAHRILSVLRSEAAGWYDLALDAAQRGTSHPKRVDAVAHLMEEGFTDGGVSMPSALGQRARFQVAVSAHARGGAVAYDGVDFYVAPTVPSAVSMVEKLTVRDGTEVTPTAREVTRYYEMGPRHVVQFHAGRMDGQAAVGFLHHDGSFTILKSPEGNRVVLSRGEYALHEMEETCVDLHYGMGELCYRRTAQHAAGDLWGAYHLAKIITGFAPVSDSHGLVLGRRLEFKYGSVLPALGGLRRKRPSRRVRR